MTLDEFVAKLEREERGKGWVIVGNAIRRYDLRARLLAALGLSQEVQ